MKAKLSPEIVEVRRVGYTMFGLTARRAAGTRILRELFGRNAAWSGPTLLIDHHYVRDVIAAVGKQIKFVPTKLKKPVRPAVQ